MLKIPEIVEIAKKKLLKIVDINSPLPYFKGAILENIAFIVQLWNWEPEYKPKSNPDSGVGSLGQLSQKKENQSENKKARNVCVCVCLN